MVGGGSKGVKAQLVEGQDESESIMRYADTSTCALGDQNFIRLPTETTVGSVTSIILHKRHIVKA